MPILGQDLEQHTTPNGFTFGATRIEHLGASEYTLVGIAVDRSSSVDSFRGELEKMLGTVVQSCRRSPRSDNLMARVLLFNHQVDELHGFKLLSDINPSDYDNKVQTSGTTALNDALLNSIAAVNGYGKKLMDSDFSVNGIVFVVTDGMENDSKSTTDMVREAVAQIRRDESLESIRVVLIGVNLQDAHVKGALDQYRQEVGVDQFIDIKDANEKTLAKLAEFISSSITAQSQSLGTGGPSQPVSFAF